jgi:hypothetical protein
MSPAKEEKYLERIGKLLAKAESTDSEAEAQELTAKAQQLATLHAIDLAAARARRDRAHRRQTPVQRKIVVGRPREQGRRHRVALFSAIARVNDMRIDVARDDTYVLAFGFDDDLAVVEKLYASLVTQMVGAANAAIRRGEHREEVYWSDAAQAWRSDARVFRTAFNLGFVATIGERLQKAREDAIVEDRVREGGVEGAAPRGTLVLAEKAVEVGDFYAEHSQARGTWRGGRLGSVAFSELGHRSGAAAGRAARLSPAEELAGARGELAGGRCPNGGRGG